MKLKKAELSQLLREGKTKEEVAKKFNVTVQAVHKRIKSLGILVAKDVALESGHEVVEQSLETVAQLFHINKAAKEILAELTGKDHIIDNMVKAVKAVLEFEAYPIKENETHLKNTIKMVISEKNTALKACDSILKQLNFQLDIYKTLYDFKAVSEFQQEVISIMGEVSPRLRSKFIKRLKEKRALRQSVTIIGTN